MQSSKGHGKWIFLKFHSLSWIWNGKVALEDACVSTKCWMFACFQTAALSLWRAWLVSVFQRAKQKELIWTKKRFYKWVEYGSSSSLYFHRLLFRSDLCWTGFKSAVCLWSRARREAHRLNQLTWALQKNGNVCRAATFDLPNPPPTRMWNCLQAEESCLRLWGPALN